MQKKIIILTPFYPPAVGGAETFAEELYRVACKRFNARVCTLSWNKLWHGINWKDSAKVALQLSVKAFTMCRSFKPATIHALGFNATFVAAVLKPVFRYKLVSTVLALYDFDNELLNALARWSMARVDTILAESDVSYDNLANVVSCLKIKVFTHWVNTEVFYPIPRKNERLKVLFVGRRIKEKGMHIIKEVEQRMKGVDFVYVTSIPHEELQKYYQMADVLVVPSLYAESPNRVVAESASCGCVVITSNKGALSEQVRDFGFSIEPTADEYYKAIKVLDEDRLWLQLLRDDVIAYARENLTEKNAEIITNEY